MKNLMKYCICCAILSAAFYALLYRAADEYAANPTHVPVVSEKERQQKNLKLLMESLAKDMCKVDPKHSMVEVEYKGKVIDCK